MMGNDQLFHKRKEIKRQKRPQRILILVEGEKTETVYFQNICDSFKLTSVSVKQAQKTDPIGILESAKEVVEKTAKNIRYTDIFLVFDLDRCDADKLKIINDHCKKQKVQRWHAFVSYPCIEVWFLLHFRYSAEPFAPNHKAVGVQAKKVLGKHMSETKRHQSSYEFLQKNKTCDPYDNAKKLLETQQKNNSTNPITNLHELVYFLENLRSFNTKDTENSFTFINL